MRAVLTPTCLTDLFLQWERYPDALPMAGGTDLLVRLRSRSGQDGRAVLSLARVEELQGIRKEGTTLAIGAATSFSRIIADPLVAEHAPLLAQAARTVGGPAIRNMATIGGNIGTASPAGESLCPLYLLEAEIEMASQRGKRCLPIGEFIISPGQTALSSGEIITRILLPPMAPYSHLCFEKVGLRRSMAIAVASFAGLVRLSGKKTIASVKCAWGSVGPTVVRIPQLEEKLIGAGLDDGSIGHAADLVRAAVSPISDLRATADYRRSVAGNLLVRFMESLRG